MAHSLTERPDIGSIRETFLFNQLLNAGLEVFTSDEGDFRQGETIIEVGGRSKDAAQVKHLQQWLVAADEIEVGGRNCVAKNSYFHGSMSTLAPMSDDLCALRLRGGDEAAFRYVMDRYFFVITQFARRIVGEQGAAEDVAEETFIKLWQSHKEVRDFQSVKAFLFIAAKNACLNEIRKRNREDTRHRLYVAGNTSEEARADREIIRAEVLALVYEAVEQLPEKMRQVFKMSYFEGLPNRDIARMLGISTNTVKAQKARALELVQERFRGEELLMALAILHSLIKN